MKQIAWALLLAASTVMLGQQTGGGGGVPGGGGTGTGLPTATAAGQVPTSTAAGTNYTAQTPTSGAYRNLTCGELSAQVTSAVTALGAAGGRIILPNCTTNTWTSSVTGLAGNISIVGYGPRATQINCSVAGTCLGYHMPTDALGEIATQISDWSMTGSNVTGQVLLNLEGARGMDLHNLFFQGPSSGTQPTCMEFHNTTTDQTFTEQNVTRNVAFATTCATSVLFLQDAGDSNSSFGYNDFDFRLGTANGNYGVVFNGGGSLYNGQLKVWANHVGPGGGVIQFNNGINTTITSNLNPSERLYVTAEENGTGAGNVISATGSGLLQFEGTIINGAPGGLQLATTVSNTGSGTFFVSNGLSTQGTNTVYTQSVATDTTTQVFSGAMPRSELCPNLQAGAVCYLTVGKDLANNFDTVGLGLNWASNGSASNRWTLGMFGAPGLTGDPSGNMVVGGPTMTVGTGSANADYVLLGSNNWRWRADTSGHMYAFNNNNTTTPLDIITVPTTFANTVKIGSNSVWGWDASAAFANTNSAADTGISRTAANVIGLGNGTQGNTSGVLKIAQLVPTGTAPTIANGAAAGTSPGTATLTGTNSSGVITVITGTATTATATLATITFNGTLNTAPQNCQLMPRNAAAALQVSALATSAPSTTAWTITVGATPVTASTTYTWGFICL